MSAKVPSVLQDTFDLLKKAEHASVIMISSIAGGPTTVNSGAPYAMTKGDCVFMSFLPLLAVCC